MFFYSWEQGTAAGAIIETENPEYSVFASSPFQSHGLPAATLRLALSAAVRQTSDGRSSQQINDALDGAALDGASAGSAVLLGDLLRSMIEDSDSQALEKKNQGLTQTRLEKHSGSTQRMHN